MQTSYDSPHDTISKLNHSELNLMDLGEVYVVHNKVPEHINMDNFHETSNIRKGYMDS